MKSKRIAAAVILSMLLCSCANSAQESQTLVSTPSTASVVSEAESSAEESSTVESTVSEAESSAEESSAAESTVSETESSAEESSMAESTVSEAESSAEEPSTVESIVSEAESSTEESKSKPRGNYTFDDGVLTVYSDHFFDKAYQIFDSHKDESAELKSIIIEDGVTKIREYAFDGCENLETVVMPDSVIEIGNHAFYGCTSLKSVKMSQNLKTIGESAFSVGSVSVLEDITIPDGVTQIGKFAFENCKNIKSIVIPYSVTEMMHGVVNHWELNQTIIIEGRSEAPDTWDKDWTGYCQADIVWDA